MLTNISRTRLIGGWIAAVIVAFAFSIVGGAELTVGAGQLWFVACLAPPAVMLLLWPGASAPTVAQMLHTDDSTKREGR